MLKSRGLKFNKKDGRIIKQQKQEKRRQKIRKSLVKIKILKLVKKLETSIILKLKKNKQALLANIFTKKNKNNIVRLF